MSRDDESQHNLHVEAKKIWELGRDVGIITNEEEGIMAVLEAKNREMMEKKKKKQPTTKEKLMKKNRRKHATKGPKKGEFPKSICR